MVVLHFRRLALYYETTDFDYMGFFTVHVHVLDLRHLIRNTIYAYDTLNEFLITIVEFLALIPLMYEG